jgi:hypothetical protein
MTVWILKVDGGAENNNRPFQMQTKLFDPSVSRPWHRQKVTLQKTGEAEQGEHVIHFPSNRLASRTS